jgi:signal transduction histidine kinase
LIKNALRFRRKKLELSLRRMNGALAIEVRDDGPGIRPEHHALIFERYAQVEADAALERKGHGLGLAGALILARRIGGDIAVHSELGQGTMFRFTLPFALNTDNEL